MWMNPRIGLQAFRHMPPGGGEMFLQSDTIRGICIQPEIFVGNRSPGNTLAVAGRGAGTPSPRLAQAGVPSPP